VQRVSAAAEEKGRKCGIIRRTSAGRFFNDKRRVKLGEVYSGITSELRRLAACLLQSSVVIIHSLFS
jgi:hypothetical protein